MFGRNEDGTTLGPQRTARMKEIMESQEDKIPTSEEIKAAAEN